MEEASTYHAVYMNPPKLTNWTKTHGGPYYVEVGKNIEVQYHTRVNITSRIHTNTSTTNGTNANGTTSPDVYQTTEEDVIKQWVYYEYDPSSVEYYYYK